MSFDRAAELFEQLRGLGPHELSAALAGTDEPEAVLELVRAMLAGDEQVAEGLDRPPQLTASWAGGPVDGAGGDRPRMLGPYELLGVLGEGGMGVVYEARQANPHRTVALKVLRPFLATEEVLGRFRDEAEVLGWLDHPGIAQIYDAGTATWGAREVPYIAMELVRGERIDRHVERSHPPIEGRLELVARLAETVHHAHRKGVVHRDLKPANVLVTPEGGLKVLDFGIARITGSDLGTTTVHTRLTRTGELLGTLAYMSPEQVSADPSRVDVRSDVYALGVMAYELLSGQRPLDLGEASLPEAARRITEDEPTTLGLLDRRLAGDTEIVIGKALAKERERRYASAEEFARDLRRKLAEEPILARPPSRAYRARKFVRRHRGLVAGLAAAALLMAVGTAVATAQYLEQSRLVERRADEADTAERAIAFLEEILDQADPFSGDELSVREVSRLAAQRIEGQFLDRPLVRARLLMMLGTTQKNLGISEEALPLLEEAVELSELHFGPDAPELAAALAVRGQVRHMLEDLEGALRDQGRAIELLRAAGPSVLLAATLSELASTLMDRAEFRRAEELLGEALKMNVELAGERDPESLSMRHNLAVLRYIEGDLEGSEAAFRAILDDAPESFGDRSVVQLYLANNLRAQRRLEEAEALLRQALETAQSRYGRETERGRTILRNLGNLLSDRGQVEEAVALQREVLEIVLRRVGPGTPEAVEATHDLAFVVHDTRDREEAERLYLEAIAGWARLGEEYDGLRFQAQHNLSMLYWAQGDLARAEDLARAALEGRIAAFGAGAIPTLASWRGLGDVLVAQERFEVALVVRREAARLCAETYGEGSANTQAVRSKLVELLVQEGLYAEAEEVLERCEAALAEMPDALDWPRRVARQHVRLYEAWGLADRLERWRAEEAAR